MIEDHFRFAIKGISNKKLRSGLTMLGVFIGIIAVVSLISLGQGLQHVIDDQFEQVGGDRILVTPGGSGSFIAGAPGGSLIAARLHESDLDVIKKTSGVDSAVGYVMASGSVEVDGTRKTISIFGVPTDAQSLKVIKQVDFFVVDKGRYLKDSDTYKIQVGTRTGEMLDEDISVGDRVVIEEISFDVVGENKKTGNPYHDSKITMPLETVQELFNKTDEYSTVMVKIEKGADIDKVAENIKEKLRRHRNVKEDEEDFSVQTAENIIQTFKDVLGVVTLVLTLIAAISLVVGGIGIMTTMYTSILERTDQIGIMKAVGARNNDIMMMFIVESGMLGLVGGVIGIILGLLISIGIEYLVVNYGGVEIFRIYAGPDLVIGALLFSFFVGCFSGYLPARRAAKMQPVEALRQ